MFRGYGDVHVMVYLSTCYFLFISHFDFKSVIWLLFAVQFLCIAFLILLIENVSFNKYLGKGKGTFELIIIIL